MSEAVENTDVELWRDRRNDYYGDSVHVTKDGGLGINVGGTVIVKPLADWHRLASTAQDVDAWIKREFSGWGAALDENPAPDGSPYMSMAVAKDLTRRAVAHFAGEARQGT